MSKKENVQKTTTKEKILISIFSTVIIISILSVGAVFLLNSSFFKNRDSSQEDDGFLDVTITTPKEEKEKYVNFLVAGIDYVEGSGRAKLTDVIMVANFDIENKKINVLQIPRDSYIGTEFTSSGKINEVYGRKNGGGIDGLAKQLNKMLNMTIDHYVTITMDGFVRVIDKLGGVEVDVPRRIELEGLVLEPGLQTLSGFRSEKFVRNRSYANADLGRLEMQQIFLKALMSKIFGISKIDILSLAPVLVKEITTDLTLGEMIGYYNSLLEVDKETGVSFHVAPVTGAFGNSKLSIMKKPLADILNEHFREHTVKVAADDLYIVELVTDYPYTPKEGITVENS